MKGNDGTFKVNIITKRSYNREENGRIPFINRFNTHIERTESEKNADQQGQTKKGKDTCEANVNVKKCAMLVTTC
jgi:hypothetical protein